MLQLNTKAKNIEVTNKHEAFKGTDFADAEFKVTMKTISSTDRFNALEDNTSIKGDKEVLDIMGLNTKLLQTTVVSWEGIGSEGKELKCTKDNIKKVFEFSSEFSQSLLSAYNTEANKEDKKKV